MFPNLHKLGESRANCIWGAQSRQLHSASATIIALSHRQAIHTLAELTAILSSTTTYPLSHTLILIMTESNLAAKMDVDEAAIDEGLYSRQL
jgi:hypothetical protein